MIVCRECGFQNPNGTDFCLNPSSAETPQPCRAYLGWADPEQTRVVNSPTAPARPQEPADRQAGGRVEVAAALTPTQASVEPAGEVTCEIRVRNLGTVVDRFQFEMQGAPSTWTLIEPAALSLFPDTESTAVLRFRPPRSPLVPAGPARFRVRAVSSTAPDVFALVDGIVDVRPYTSVQARIMPQTSRGTHRAEHRLIVENQGNASVRLVLEAGDPDGALELLVDPPVLTVAPGATAVANIAVTPRQPPPGPGPAPRPFDAQIQGPGDQLVRLPAMFIHEPAPVPVPAAPPPALPPPRPQVQPQAEPQVQPQPQAQPQAYVAPPPAREARGRMGAGGCLVVLLLGILLIVGLAALAVLGYPLAKQQESYFNPRFLGITGGVLFVDLVLMKLIRMTVRFSRRRGARQALQAGYPPAPS